MKSVLIAAKQYQSLAGSAERGILKQILDNPENAAQCTIRRMAELSYTSPSTVVRLCRKRASPASVTCKKLWWQSW